MTEDKAREILGGCIQPDNSLAGYVGDDHHDGSYIDWTPPDRTIDVTLDGNLSFQELEAIAWWMRNKGTL